tara:strand:+ start:132 stop:986 length:855 start_codon:yes stop_codon:yes gene_type:complete
MGEIVLKSRPVRRFMRKALERHICAQVEARGSRVKVRPWQGLLFLELIEGEEVDVEDALRHTFGLTSADPFFAIEVDPTKVAAAVIANAPEKEGATFAVQCKRHGEKGEWNSQTFAGAVGAEILALAPHLKVNLGNPEWPVRIALMPDEVGILGERIICQGGLPTGVQGTVFVNLQSERDYLASWLVMRRGCRLSFSNESKSHLMELVSIWDPYYKSQEFKKILATAPGPGHIGEIWAVVGDKLSGSLEMVGNIPIATLEPLEGWSEDSLEELRDRSEFIQAIA